MPAWFLNYIHNPATSYHFPGEHTDLLLTHLLLLPMCPTVSALPPQTLHTQCESPSPYPGSQGPTEFAPSTLRPVSYSVSPAPGLFAVTQMCLLCLYALAGSNPSVWNPLYSNTYMAHFLITLGLYSHAPFLERPIPFKSCSYPDPALSLFSAYYSPLH